MLDQPGGGLGLGDVSPRRGPACGRCGRRRSNGPPCAPWRCRGGTGRHRARGGCLMPWMISWDRGCSPASSPTLDVGRMPIERSRCSSTVKWWYMLNCISATMRPNSRDEAAEHAGLVHLAQGGFGIARESSVDMNRRLASSSARRSLPMRLSERAPAAAHWDGSPCCCDRRGEQADEVDRVVLEDRRPLNG
jgi:hypothetical protein